MCGNCVDFFLVVAATLAASSVVAARFLGGRPRLGAVAVTTVAATAVHALLDLARLLGARPPRSEVEGDDDDWCSINSFR